MKSHKIIAFVSLLLFTNSSIISMHYYYLVEGVKRQQKNEATQNLRNLLNSYQIHDLKINELFNQVPNLIASGADLNIKDNYHNTLLMRAVKNNRDDIVKMLLAAGADPNIQTNANETALYFAVREGYLNLAQQLLAAKADPNIITVTGDAPLFQAIKNQQTAMVRLLLDNGANLQLTDVRGSTPLEAAQQTRNEEIIKLIRNKLGM